MRRKRIAEICGWIIQTFAGLSILFVVWMIALLLGGFAGCVTVAPVPVSTAGCAEACANLARLKCPEGLDVSCTASCLSAQAARLTDLKPACLASADSIEAARACGTVTCQ